MEFYLPYSSVRISKNCVNLGRRRPLYDYTNQGEFISKAVGATSTGFFSLKSAYGKIREGTLNSKEQIWEIPWKIKGPQWICFFLWLALKQRLLTNAKRVRRGIGSSRACGFCGQDYEDVLHVLRDCLTARTIWNKLIPEGRLSKFYIGSLSNWMTENLQNHLNISLDGSNDKILKISFTWAKRYNLISKTTLHKSQSYLHSSPIASSWVYLRTDGSIRLDEEFAAAGGYVCDHNGGWIIGFCRYLGNCTVTEAELWGILNGLNLLLER
ncbi:hypothetical protein Golob_001221 [Gossypium lobatum]|uniref:Reverse transcriptase zinc-binding domain-containing protein n=1 Tax=Gossypium lobatum TaxID=34289 RepID=A0A7J8NAF2_9ROSI|nr:hypothetical protein [Gossypium lobatum]